MQIDPYPFCLGRASRVQKFELKIYVTLSIPSAFPDIRVSAKVSLHVTRQRDR